MAAIDALAAQIGPDIKIGRTTIRLRAEFVDGRKKLDEKTFFAHVEKNCPGAAPCIGRLLEAVCENLDPLTSATTSHKGAMFDRRLRLRGAALAVLDKDSNACAALRRR